MRVYHSDVPVTELAEIEAFRKVLDTWETLRSDLFAPPWQASDLLLLPSTVVPYVTVVDVHGAGEDFVYRFWGTGHTTIKGDDLTGRSASEHEPRELGKIIFEEYRKVIAERRPLGFRHDLMPYPDRFSLYQDTLRLPLSGDGETVTQVISFADWRTRSREWKRLFRDIQRTA